MKDRPASDGLNLVEEATDRLNVFLFWIDGIIGLSDQVEIVLPQVVETVVEKVQVQDVLPRDPAIQQPPDDLEHVG